MGSFWDTKSGKLSIRGEDVYLGWMRSGVFAWSARDYNGKDGSVAPMIKSATEGIVLPDFFCAWLGTSWWIEVKYKTIRLYWKNHSCYYIGIESRLLSDYSRIAFETGLRCDLVVYCADVRKWFYLPDVPTVTPSDLGCEGIRTGDSAGTPMSNYYIEWFTEFSSNDDPLLLPVIALENLAKWQDSKEHTLIRTTVKGRESKGG